MAVNAAAALAVALVCEVPLDAAADAVSGAALSPWRMELRRTAGGALVLNDAYNANPTSMRAALETLAALPGPRRRRGRRRDGRARRSRARSTGPSPRRPPGSTSS